MTRLLRVVSAEADHPPQATLSSSVGSGVTSSNVIPITATFDAPVTGVTAADFNGGTPFPVEAGVTYAVTGGPTQWVLTVTVDEAPRATKALTFGFADNTGSISPPAQASTAPFSVTCVAAVLLAIVCGMIGGRVRR